MIVYIIHHPLTSLYWVLYAYGAGVLGWIIRSFFDADYFTWPEVFKGFIWPWLWIKRKLK